MVSLAAEESRNGWAILCDGWELRKDGPFYSDWRDFKWERYVGDGGSVSKFLCLESTERADQSRVGPWPFENSHMVLTSQMVLWLRLTKAYIWITLCKCSRWKPWSHQQLECKFSISYKKKKQLDWVKSVTSIPCLGLAPPNPLHTFFF